jgi:predicted ATPase
MKTTVIIMQGVPGSGKSTYARRLRDVGCGLGITTRIVSADDYFVDGDGVYRFDPGKLGTAHAVCMRAFLDELRAGACDGIVVDNTNTTAIELAPYMAVAASFGAPAKIVRMECDVNAASQRNVHGVPHDKILAMYDRMVTERLPPYWKFEVVR